MSLKRGFTLVEMLIVLSITGLVIALFAGNYAATQKASRDARRLADMNDILTALQSYYADHGFYPGSTTAYGEANCAGWDTTFTDGDNDGNSFIDPLYDEGYLEKMPIDPLTAQSNNCGGHGNNGYNYFYFRYAAGSYGCDPTFGPYIVLGVGSFETDPGVAHPKSEGFICSGRDWHDTLDYVVGRYEGG